MNANKLGEYSTHICGEIKKSISENISELTSSVSMLSDMQRIMDELTNIIAEQQKTIVDLNEQLEKNTTLLSDRENEIARLRTKEEEYSKVEIDAMQIAATLKNVTEKNELLNDERIQLQSDKDKFEVEKEKIIRERDTALGKFEKANRDRDDAINSRDKAIKEKNDFLSHCNEYKAIIDDLKKKISEYDERCTIYENSNNESKELVEWYKKYAIALDQKIIDFYEKRDVDSLPNHFYHYLNDDRKIEEIREHFPEFKKEKLLGADDKVNNNNSSEEVKEWKGDIEKSKNKKDDKAVQKVPPQDVTRLKS